VTVVEKRSLRVRSKNIRGAVVLPLHGAGAGERALVGLALACFSPHREANSAVLAQCHHRRYRDIVPGRHPMPMA
jgi:hypothetical protein